LAGVVLGIVLFALWVGVEARRVHNMRESNPWAMPSTAPPQIKTNAVQTQSTNDLLAGFHDALLPGNADAGRKIFFEKPEANCGKCHKVGGQGADTGPTLDGVGSRRTREYILEAMLYPNLHVTTNYETVIVILKDGRGLSGFLKGEDATNLVVNTPEDGLVNVAKSEIQVRQKGISPMPEGLGKILSRQDLRDLLEYVASLKK
jgi:quinoprotein glucose dehydrogenase